MSIDAYIFVDTENGKIIIEPKDEDRKRIVLIPPRKGQSVHITKDDLPVALANTARQLTRKVIDSLLIPDDFPMKMTPSEIINREG